MLRKKVFLKARKAVLFALCTIMMFTFISPVLSDTAIEQVFEQSPVSAEVLYSSENFENDCAELSFETYVKNITRVNPKVNACDIVVAFDGSFAADFKRAEIINFIKKLIGDLPSASKGEHKICLAGFGRINNSGESDSQTGFSGTHYDCLSYNTGYYTYSDSQKTNFVCVGGGVNQNGSSDLWTEYDDYNPLPSVDCSLDYSDCFMSAENAAAVLENPDLMCMWNSGASRTDAGLVMVQKIADAHIKNKKSDSENSERGLMIVLAASSPAMQSTGSGFYSRTFAVNYAAEDLKSNYGAKIYALGNYNAASPVPAADAAGNLLNTQSNFENMMKSIASGEENYFSGSDSTNLQSAAANFLCKADDGALDFSAQEFSVDVLNSLPGASEIFEQFNINLNEAAAEFYSFKGYGTYSEPLWSDTPLRTLQNQTPEISQEGIFYKISAVPIPSKEIYECNPQKYTCGEKIKITLKGKAKPNSLFIKKNVFDSFGNLISKDENFYFFITGPSGYKTCASVNSANKGTLLFNLVPGTYTIKELPLQDYKFKNARIFVNSNETHQTNSLEAVVVLRSGNYGKVIFENEKFESSVFAKSRQSLTNKIKCLQNSVALQGVKK